MGFQPPLPPYGRIPFEQHFSYAGASLTQCHFSIWTQRVYTKRQKDKNTKRLKDKKAKTQQYKNTKKRNITKRLKYRDRNTKARKIVLRLWCQGSFWWWFIWEQSYFDWEIVIKQETKIRSIFKVISDVRPEYNLTLLLIWNPISDLTCPEIWF